MKLSTKPRHVAHHSAPMNSKNEPGHRSMGGHGITSFARKLPNPASIVRMIFGALSRRTRRVFMDQERAIAKA
jgi:hypothetical protein